MYKEVTFNITKLLSRIDMKKKKNRLHDPRLLFYIFLQLNKEKTKQILPELGTFALMTLKKTNETKKKH